VEGSPGLCLLVDNPVPLLKDEITK